MSDPISDYQSLLENVPCNLCGADDYRIIYPPQYALAKPDQLKEVFRSSGDETLIDPLVRCKKCGLQYLNPRLRSHVVLDSYRQGKDETFVSQAAAREHTFAKGLLAIERLHPKKGKILDVGTAGGSFLAVAKKQGWEVAGCEPSEWLVSWAKEHYGLTIHRGTLSDMSSPDHYFDVVTLWDVLEHTPDPQSVLRECRRILKPNGLLLVNYPGSQSLVARLMGRKWVFLLSVHLYYFTFKTLKKMLAAAGFKVVRQQQHWQTLELDYILLRMNAYLPGIASFGQKAAKRLGIQKALVPYWMGQYLAFAKPSEE